jgi:hypothetical protein
MYRGRNLAAAFFNLEVVDCLQQCHVSRRRWMTAAWLRR